MRYLPTSKLMPGMALGQDLYDGAGRLLLAKHLLLTAEYISNLEFLGFPGVYIDDEFSRGIEIQQILSPQVRSQALKVVHDMFSFDTDAGGPVNEMKVRKTIERIVEEILSNGDVMCNVLEIKNYDDYIYYHSISVAMLSTMIGTRYGLDEEKLFQLTTAAILHDIGKKFLELELVKAEHPLTPAEEKELAKHPKLGVDYLKSTYHFPAQVHAGILLHHENYDGSGYPMGKSGEQISLYARIIRIADCYDNMVSRQPQKKETSPSDAMEYLMAGAGTIFDPQLVELFVQKIAVYPIGCEVELSDGTRAIVVKNLERFFLRPVIKIIGTGEEVNLRDNPKYRSITITKMILD